MTKHSTVNTRRAPSVVMQGQQKTLHVASTRAHRLVIMDDARSVERDAQYTGQLDVPFTSAGLFHMDELIWKTHDVRILLLAHISQEMEQCLLQIS